MILSGLSYCLHNPCLSEEGRVLLAAAFALLLLYCRWREILARNDNTCGDSKRQNSHESLLDLTFLIAATDPKAPVY